MNNDQTKKMLKMFKIYASALNNSEVSVKIVGPDRMPRAYEELPNSNDTARQIVEIPNADWSNANHRLIAEANIAHEALHHIYTDFNVLCEAHRNHSAFEKDLLNCIEDPYIEFKGCQRWNGLAYKLNMFKAMILKNPQTFDTAAEALTFYVLLKLYKERCGFNGVDKALYDLETLMKKELGNNFSEFESIVLKGLITKNTTENLRLTFELTAFLKKIKFFREPESNDSESNDEQSDDQNGSNDSESNDEQSDNQNGSNDSESNDEQSDNQNGSNDSESNDEQSDNQNGSNDSESSYDGSNSYSFPYGGSLEPSDKEQLQLQREHKAGRGNLTEQAIKILKAEAEELPIELCGVTIKKQPRTGSVSDEDMRVGITQRAKLVRVLEPMFKAKKRSRISHNKKGNSLVKRQLYRALTDGKCLRESKNEKAVNSSVNLLLDISASMRNGGRMARATQATIALMAAMDNLKVKNSCYMYCSRGGSCILTPAKRKNDKFHVLRTTLSTTPYGGTPTSEALMYGNVELLKEPNNRKIQFVITDGEAANNETLLFAYQSAVNLGIETYFIVIAGNKLPDIPKQIPQIIVEDTSKLSETLNKVAVKVFHD